jgi:uncharacterized membrane protein HdeD (DUF308 family)
MGSILVAVGILEVVTAIRLRSSGPFLRLLFGGVLTGVVGGLFLYRPLAGMEALTLLVAFHLFAGGLFCGITSVADRYRGWGWDLAYGLVATAMGVWVVMTFPVSSLWVIGTVVSVEIISRGFALAAASWALRDVEHAAPQPA